MQLEKTEIDAFTCPLGRREALVFDDKLAGFGLRVTAKGAKTFIFQYLRGVDAAGRPKVHRIVLGRYGTKLTPAQARKLALKAAAAVVDGRHPAEERRDGKAAEKAARIEAARLAAVEAFTLENLVKAWTDGHLATASPAHRREAPAAVRRCFKALLTKPADTLTAAEVQAAVDDLAIARKHATAARRARDYARAMGNWGVQREKLTRNPFATTRVDGREVSRERVLSDAELGAVWRAAGTLAYPFGPLFRLLILTMQRRTEVAAMRWAELDKDLTTWTLPAARAKNGKGHLIPLAESARAILLEVAKRPRLPRQTLVFSTTGKTAVSGFSRAVAQLAAAIAAEPAGPAGRVTWQGPWTVHDLRRTGATTLARLGVSLHVADRMLNHTPGTLKGVTAVYQRHEFLAEREAAARLWADHVLAVAKAGAPVAEAPLSSNVVRLHRRGAKPGR